MVNVIAAAASSGHVFGVTIGVSDITPITSNGYRSFFVAPDGSKEGWQESFDGDKARDEIVKALDSFKDPDDNSTSVEYVEVQFGDDNHDNRVLRASR